MWISSLEINNIKSFETSEQISLSRNMNILLGPNNSGKSTIIKVLYLLQQRRLEIEDIRIGSDTASGYIKLTDVNIRHFKDYIGSHMPILRINAIRTATNWPLLDLQTAEAAFTPFPLVPSTEPHNFIYPYLSKRKVGSYQQDVGTPFEREVSDTLNRLVAKVDRLANKNHPRHEEFEQACVDILEFPITAFQSSNGKQAGIIIDEYNNIPLDAMGEGVPNLLGLIVNLCMARDKLFLIEEIENDVHPGALKKLLELISKKAEYNQFVISTHSNIVARYLGAIPSSKVFQIAMSPYTSENRLPTSICRAAATPKERREALEALGYELTDYYLAKGWLFFEESSAERIIREFLIPWFAPRLRGRIGTIAAQGTGDVEPRFKDFNRLFVFLHLSEEIYKNYAWVIVDGENSGREVIAKLKDMYVPRGWAEDRFLTLSLDNFECYYPSIFSEDVSVALNIKNKDAKREAKRQLLEKVLDWIVSNEQEAKAEFEKYAAEVIGIIRSIETSLFPVE